MQHLNLPEAQLQLRRDPDGTVRVYDPLRKMWLVVTPEEWVRQHFVNFLISGRGYPASRVANEVTIRLNNTVKRCDTVIYSPSLRPLAIVEYKAPEVAVTQRVFEQIGRYNIVLDVPLLMVSNGLSHYACRIAADGSYRFLRDVPSWDELTDQKK